MGTVRELRALADNRLYAGDYAGALHAYTLIVRLQPVSFDARLRVADCLLALGYLQPAAVVYASLARFAANSGYPLIAIVAIKVLSQLEPQLEALLDSFAQLYASGSQRLGRSARHAPGDPSQALPPGVPGPMPAIEQLVPVAQQLAADVAGAAYPEKLPPIPLFSELPRDAFAAVLHPLKLVRTRPGETILAEGDAGLSFFVLARGSVDVLRAGPGGDPHKLATLHDGAIFGEMALVSSAPRTASVIALTDCDLLEFDRDALGAAAQALPTIARALDQFTRERLLNNLLTTSPLFRPLDREQRLALFKRFTSYDVQAGTDVIVEGTPGQGLFVVLSGEVDVSKIDGMEKVLLATLKTGDLFGEISLLHDRPTSATVTAATNCTVLFLARDYFQRLIEAIPAIRAYVEGLSETRLMDTQVLMDSFPTEELSAIDLTYSS